MIRRKILKNSEDEVVKTVLKGSRWFLVRNRTDLSSRDEKRLTEILNLWPGTWDSISCF
jgi:hypothetical protein